MTIQASARFLEGWNFAASRVRYDYFPPDHLLEDILKPRYFLPLASQLSEHDLITITDAEGKIATVRVAWIDRKAGRVEVDVIETAEQKPIIEKDDYQIRNRGGRGGRWCVIKGTEDAYEIVARDFATREQAEAHLKTLKG